MKLASESEARNPKILVKDFRGVLNALVDTAGVSGDLELQMTSITISLADRVHFVTDAFAQLFRQDKFGDDIG
ncbi:hypothetical protein D4A92_22920 (plasmid) [Rhizobium rosettiformans]|uniref:Uncharacterized protein n=1 Tax=Rhizobium rosettiformans TaxID=1368430 RepID=A0ABX7F254_9HYPH|nr:hypothetical protein D4A92_22920 [Rhizobium rosettiformans]